MPGAPALVPGTTAVYTLLCSSPWFDSWQPNPAPGEFALSSLVLAHGSLPPSSSIFTISVVNDDPSAPLLAPVSSFQNIWTDPPLNFIFASEPPELRQAIWVPIPPQDYVALGVFVTTTPFSPFGPAPPPPTGVMCLRSSYAVGGTFGSLVYNGNGYGGIEPTICIQTIQQSLATFAYVGPSPPSAPVFVPNSLSQST